MPQSSGILLLLEHLYLDQPSPVKLTCSQSTTHDDVSIVYRFEGEG